MAKWLNGTVSDFNSTRGLFRTSGDKLFSLSCDFVQLMYNVKTLSESQFVMFSFTELEWNMFVQEIVQSRVLQAPRTCSTTR